MDRGAFLQWYQAQSQCPRKIVPAQKPEALSLWADRVLKSRGRPWTYPYMESGRGNGPFVELIDGSVKLDLITGIGVHFFGHAHPDLKWAAVESLMKEPDAIQGNLQFGPNYIGFMEDLLEAAQSCKPTRLAHVWLAPTGAMCNENALKIVRQKRAPGFKVLTFDHGFYGRTQTLAEITDNVTYKVGLPDFKQVTKIPFFTEQDPKFTKTLKALDEALKNAAEYCVFATELIQGEGGFRTAPREFFQAVFERVRSKGLPIWIDEVQTFGRTGEYFAFQKLGLEEFVDVVSIGKLSHACATLFTKELNPKAGLVSGTFSGSTTSLGVGRWVLKTLREGKFLGPKGRISSMEGWVREDLTELMERQPKISNLTVVGGMVAFQVGDGSEAQNKAYLSRLYENGVIAFNCGHDPTRVRLLLPAGVLTADDFSCGLKAMEASLDGVK